MLNIHFFLYRPGAIYLLIQLILLTGTLTAVLPFSVYSQEVVSGNEKLPLFTDGEEIRYEVYYNWGLLWVPAGEIRFVTNIDTVDGEPVYRFLSTGRSWPFYDWLFTVRDTFRSVADLSLPIRPRSFERKTREGSYSVHNRYRFDYDKKSVYTFVSNSGGVSRIDTLHFEKELYDVLTAVYYLRSCPVEEMPPGDTLVIPFIIDGERYDLPVKMHGVEEITGRDDNSCRCYRMSVRLVGGTMFREGEELTVWVTGDGRRVAFRIEAEILVGSVKAFLKE
ncbi:MAG: hypothetical protein Kow00127_02730 [Bacteroidales bacterium]